MTTNCRRVGRKMTEGNACRQCARSTGNISHSDTTISNSAGSPNLQKCFQFYDRKHRIHLTKMYFLPNFNTLSVLQRYLSSTWKSHSYRPREVWQSAATRPSWTSQTGEQELGDAGRNQVTILTSLISSKLSKSRVAEKRQMKFSLI